MTNYWQTCWDSAPEIYVLLKESDTLESAREKTINFIAALDWSYRRDLDKIRSWDYILFKEAVRCLNNILSPRNERLAQSSALEHLWTAASTGEADVSDDFIEEFIHLFKALKGQSEVYPSTLTNGSEQPDFDSISGREAGILRSDYLDRVASNMDRYLGRYPSGFTSEIVEKRIQNKRKILDLLGATDDDWDTWKWQFRNVLMDLDGVEVIKKVIDLESHEEEAIRRAIENNVPFGITPHYLHLMDETPGGYDHAIRRQVFPPLSYVDTMIEHNGKRSEVFDFMRESDTSPEGLVTRRYPKVAIIKPYDSCPQICVYCQRNWEITSPFMPTAMASKEKLEKALDWFADHPEIIDVLVTGGDPLVMGDRNIDHILRRLSEIPHLKSIRIATRIPITVPQRLTDELCEIFASYYEVGKQTLCMVTHFSHPYEVTRDTAMAIKRVKMQGLHVYNQQVFTFANSRRFETAALRIAIKQIGVDPYYTFNMKGKSEIENYAVPVARILQERKEEARMLPGMFRPDEPVFNVPFLGKNHLRAWQDHELIAIQPDGRRVYSFHPWEKNIEKVKPYIYIDVKIRSYLQQLQDRGEDIEDYRSIWYYY